MALDTPFYGKAEQTRRDRLAQWVARRQGLAVEEVDLKLAAGDASFRRYFRLALPDGSSRIIMDAPPDREDSQPFVTIASQWESAGLPVPTLHGIDLDAGFIELDDLGDITLERFFTDATTVEHYIERAIPLVHRLQNRAPLDALPLYDTALLERELELFPDWCLDAYLQLAPPPGWPAIKERLIASALAQPRVVVHRDYDAMNLMLHGDTLYLIDFQDAVAGPVNYDLVSLLRGRYCRLEPADFAAWVEAFRRQAVEDGRLDPDIEARRFLRQADEMAAQRTLKILGIFCRLTLRDGKTGYLARLPHFLAHLGDSLAPWPAFEEFLDWLENTFSPRLHDQLQKDGIIPGATA